jgi:hypothetical protein
VGPWVSTIRPAGRRIEDEEEILNCDRGVRDEIRDFVEELPGALAEEME